MVAAVAVASEAAAALAVRVAKAAEAMVGRPVVPS